VDEENIREVHEALCHEAASHSRSYSPFEITAKEFNSSEFADELWEAFGEGGAAAIADDLASYTDEDYDIDSYAEEEARLRLEGDVI
jgi:hypothetical protein